MLLCHIQQLQSNISIHLDPKIGTESFVYRCCLNNLLIVIKQSSYSVHLGSVHTWQHMENTLKLWLFFFLNFICKGENNLWLKAPSSSLLIMPCYIMPPWAGPWRQKNWQLAWKRTISKCFHRLVWTIQKKRTFKKLHAEDAEADTVPRNQWLKDQWGQTRQKYTAENIWNANESGNLFLSTWW